MVTSPARGPIDADADSDGEDRADLPFSLRGCRPSSAFNLCSGE